MNRYVSLYKFASIIPYSDSPCPWLSVGNITDQLLLSVPDKLEFVGEKFQMGNGKWEIELAESS